MSASEKDDRSLFGSVSKLFDRGLVLLVILFLFAKCAIAPNIHYISGDMTADTRATRGSEPPVSVSLTRSMWAKKNHCGVYVELYNRSNTQLFCHIYARAGAVAIKSKAVPANGSATFGGIIDNWLLDEGAYLLRFDGYDKKIYLEIEPGGKYTTLFAR